MIAEIVVLGVGHIRLWACILFVGFTVIERRTKRYRRGYAERPLTLELR